MHELQFATPTHQRAHDLVCELLYNDGGVLAVALCGSAARTVGAFDSDLDYNIFFAADTPAEEIMARVHDAFAQAGLAGQKSGQNGEAGIFFGIDLHAAPTVFVPKPRSWTSGPDDFELEIGNTFVYTRLIFEREQAFTQAQANYLPYYDESLRQRRLAATLDFCTNNLDHVEPFLRRGLYFQAFRRVYDASLEFLQALFIAKRTYPIAYDKWVKAQLVEILGLPGLYRDFVALYELGKLESDELALKARQLHEMIAEHIAGSA